VDLAAVIGAALEVKAAGWGHRPIAARLGVPAATVRGWLRRFRVVAGALTQRLMTVAADADRSVRAPPAGAPLVVALTAVAVTAAAVGGLSNEKELGISETTLGDN
jgi:transposase-like protein